MENNVIKERNSNFELLRIFAMCAIIACHFVTQGGSLKVLHGINLLFACLIGSMGRISVNLFLFVGVWHMAEQKFRPEKILVLYGTTWFYVFSIMVLMHVFGFKMSVLNTIKCIFPFFEISLWFVTVYIMLMLLSPFLQKILSWEKSTLKTLISVFGFIIITMATIGHKSDGWLSAITWFSFVYLCFGYYKKYLREKYENTVRGGVMLFFAAALYLIIAVSAYITLENSQNSGLFRGIYGYIKYIIGDFKTLPNVLVSLGVFCYFMKLNIGKIRFINVLAKSSLAVYIIHQTPGFYNFLWHEIFMCDKFMNTVYYPLYSTGVILAVYIGCFLLDVLRLKYIEPLWIKSELFNRLKVILENVYRNVT